ncbi:BPTI/Kunitz domain-containing protein-like [Dysidea avara]|uniref:BPTI/Kunitz domain-containing protein-like n=1 Tax=Dysidea avara TaxID=196820 RepID=UPI00331AA0B6
MQLLSFTVICFLTVYVNGDVLVPSDPQRRAVNDLCSLPMVVGPCRAAFPRWFYNSASQRCESFTYGGCRGNANRFKTRELCESACKCDRCTLQRDPGPCRAFVPSYFYNVTSRKCEKFIYGGCEGNDNRFSSATDCASQCSGRPIVRPQQASSGKPRSSLPQSRRCSTEGQIYMSCGTACPMQ